MQLANVPGMQQDICAVSRYIAEILPGEEGKTGEIIAAVQSAEGKRYRPVMLLLAGRCGSNWKVKREQLCRLGAVIELIHMASLIHDDIVDDSPLRRGQATIQARFGKDMAVYTGDLLLGRIMAVLFQHGSRQAGIMLGQTIQEMCRGEIGQFDSRFDTEATAEGYLQNIRGKTASLFVAACRMGAIESGCDDKLTETLGTFGLHLGYLFQLRDDLLDFLSDEAKEGKPTHIDFKEGIFTLPVLSALAHPEYRSTVKALAQQALMGQFSPQDSERLDWVVRRSGGLDTAFKQMELHRQAAEELVETLPAPQVAQAFHQLLSQLTLPASQQQYVTPSLMGQAV